MEGRKIIYSSMSHSKPVVSKRPTLEDNVAVWKVIAQQFCLRIELLQRQLGRYRKTDGSPVSFQKAYETMKQWREAGIVDYQDKWVWLTPYGMKLSGERYEALPAGGDLNHKYVDAQVRMWIEETKPALLEYIPGRHLQKENNRLAPKARGFHIADGWAVFPEKNVMVETELNRKTPSEMEAIVSYYEADPEINAVWYFLNDKTYGFVPRFIEGHDRFHHIHIHEIGIKELSEIV
jgi:hypothetical protein